VFEFRRDKYYGVDDTGLYEKLKLRHAIWANSYSHTLAPLAETGGPLADDPCMYDETIFQTVLKNVRAILAANPTADFISVSQNDGGDWCHCETCAANEALYGASHNYIQFINRLADIIKDEYPDVKIHTFAYYHTIEPPKSDIKVADNVMLQFTPITSCRSHPLDECDAADIRSGVIRDRVDVAAAMKGWSEIANYIGVWDYVTNFGIYNMGVPNLKDLAQNMRLFADNNAKYVMEQGAHDWATNGEFAELKAYLLGKLLWDPYMEEEKYYALMDEFLKDFYGPGWENIRAFIDYADEVTNDIHFGWWLTPAEYLKMTVTVPDRGAPIPELSADTLRNYKDVDWSPYYMCINTMTCENKDLIDKGFAWFAAAMEAAETEEQRAHIDKSMIQVEMLNAYYYDQLYLRCAYTNLGNIYDGNIAARIADGSMTKEEGNTLKAAFKADIRMPLREEAISLTKDLAHKMLKYGITSLRMATTTQMFLDGIDPFWD